MISDGESAAIQAEWHDVLLRLAGWLSDEDLTQARDLLAEGQLDGVARVIAEAIGSGLVPYSERDAARLRHLLADYTDDPSLVDAGIREKVEAPPGGFAPVPPWGIGPTVIDAIDRAVMAAAERAQLTKLSRVWRYPVTGLQSPRRVYLAETAPQTAAAQIAGELQTALARAGELTPQVEVFTVDTDLPQYHRYALHEAEELWPEIPNDAVHQ